MYIYTYTLIHTHAYIHTYTTYIPIYLCTQLYIVLSVPSSIPPYTFYTPLLYIVHPALLYIYIYIYVHIHIYIHSHAYIHTYTTDIPIYLCTQLYIVLSVPSSIPPYTFYTPLLYIVHPYTHSCNCLLAISIYIYIYIHTYTYIPLYTYIYIHIHIPLCPYTQIPTYILSYIYTHTCIVQTNTYAYSYLYATPRPAYIPLTPYRHVHPCPTII